MFLSNLNGGNIDVYFNNKFLKGRETSYTPSDSRLDYFMS